MANDGPCCCWNIFVERTVVVVVVVADAAVEKQPKIPWKKEDAFYNFGFGNAVGEDLVEFVVAVNDEMASAMKHSSWAMKSDAFD